MSNKVKTPTQKHEKNKIKQELMKNPHLEEIYKEIEGYINERLETSIICKKIEEKYNVSHTNASNWVKKCRKKLGVYKYGSGYQVKNKPTDPNKKNFKQNTPNRHSDLGFIKFPE